MTEDLRFAFTRVQDLLTSSDIPDRDRAEALAYIKRSRDAVQRPVRVSASIGNPASGGFAGRAGREVSVKSYGTER